MTNLNLKIELAKQAIKTQTPAETLEALYTQHKIEPAQHQNPLTKKLFHGKNVYTLELEMLLKGYLLATGQHLYNIKMMITQL